MRPPPCPGERQVYGAKRNFRRWMTAVGYISACHLGCMGDGSSAEAVLRPARQVCPLTALERSGASQSRRLLRRSVESAGAKETVAGNAECVQLARSCCSGMLDWGTASSLTRAICLSTVTDCTRPRDTNTAVRRKTHKDKHRKYHS